MAEFEALQNEGELARLIELVQQEGVQSYLEIGAKFGGSLWRIGSALPPGSKIVAVDLPHAENKVSLQNCVERLRGLGHTVTLIWGDSTHADVISAVKLLGQFDLVLIDANHTLPYVTKDWETYGPLARIVAFHDIGWRRDASFGGVAIEVPQFWNAIKGGYRHEEIKLDVKGKDNGIGVLWR